MKFYEWKSASARWYMRWRIAISKAKYEQNPGDRDVYQFAACIANAGYVINLALEKNKEVGGRPYPVLE